MTPGLLGAIAEIKPVSGIDFKPAPFVQTAQAAPPVERPPTLQPSTAAKLLELADDLHASLVAAKALAYQVPLTLPNAHQGL